MADADRSASCTERTIGRMPLDVIPEEVAGDTFPIGTALAGTNTAEVALTFVAVASGMADKARDDGKAGEELILEHKSEGTKGGAVARILNSPDVDDPLIRGRA